jgi:hypothetical protein
MSASDFGQVFTLGIVVHVVWRVFRWSVVGMVARGPRTLPPKPVTPPDFRYELPVLEDEPEFYRSRYPNTYGVPDYDPETTALIERIELELANVPKFLPALDTGGAVRQDGSHD